MLTSDLNLSKNCKRIEILKCVLKNVHYYYYYYCVCPMGFEGKRCQDVATLLKSLENFN